MNDGNDAQLSLEQSARLAIFKHELANLNRLSDAKDLLIQLYTQLLLKDALYRQLFH